MDQRSQLPQIVGAAVPVAVLAVLVVGYFASLGPVGAASDIGDSPDYSVDVFRQPAESADSLDRVDLRPTRPEPYGLTADADPLSTGAPNVWRRSTPTKPDPAAYPAADEAMTAEPPSPAEAMTAEPPSPAEAKAAQPPAGEKAPPKDDRGPAKAAQPPAGEKAPPKDDRGPAKAAPKDDRASGGG